MKKSHIALLLPLVFFAAYLSLAHSIIYYKIGVAELLASDKTYSYILPSTNPKAPALTYAAIGDSLTSGVGVKNYQDSYPYLVAQQLTNQAQAINLKNFSYPGASTSDVINNLLSPAIAAKPHIVTILIGTNDIHGLTRQYTFERNYKIILDRLTKETRAKIYLVSIPYLGSKSLLLFPYNYYFPYKVRQFNAVIVRLAQQYKTGFIDITNPTAKLSQGAAGYYSADEFHPSTSGYKLWAHLIYDGITR